MNCWWKMEDDFVCVYCDDLKQVKKLNLKPMATYEKNGKMLAYQFRCEKFSTEYKKLFKVLGLKTKDEYKVKITNKVKKEK